MSTIIDTIRDQIATAYHARLADVKTHQEALDAARDDVRKLAQMLAGLQAEADDPDEPPERMEPPDEVPPMQVNHVIDVGALAASQPVQNPFRHQPDSPAYHVWDLMQAGKPWHVRNGLLRALAEDGHPWKESTIYNVFRRHPTVFEGRDGVYRVTATYRVATLFRMPPDQHVVETPEEDS